ncbi:psp operon transcriptional activator [Endobacter medicaginis]|uniref:Phage shock protein operon transcriptional activator n=1 Tax=Endobacter medicaginis TaxID=1181271 RepID=A0A850NQJ6_9PROT|nr:phage shock protein operon transcriptional activator [Endobacter medicaginis]MBB3172854.1 psp operon transcriptional activator [Endobacter medicaginis]MCX5474781.1 phage shock protein operon transcriptional activator [Endobacter medicaginis]NVN29248.1 phage shock protein operon transcriptional activator [Endobacter medicaginis]
MARIPRESEAPTPLGVSPPFLEMLAHISQAAPLDRPVLAIGERGTGKELVAGRLNFLSRRWDRPFIKLNCAALSESLLDSELFGHEAGAFTGAAKRRPGRFELADGGTLFLDEIATASLAVQEKLLRVIEYGSFERVGGGEPVHVDVRVIAATHADLPAMARAGKFRADLLDRLAFDVIALPPLRHRREDIELLASHFATRMTAELGREAFAGFTSRAKDTLLAHDWPGNVRELRNVVERSVYRMEKPERPLDRVLVDPFAGATVAAFGTQHAQAVPAARPETISAPAEPVEGDFLTRTRAYEAKLLREALEAARFNQANAARALGLTYYQFRHYLKTHGIGQEKKIAS